VSSNNLTLANDATALAPYLFADGTRNTFDMAFNADGDLIGPDNGPDIDFPDEINWLQEGKHYGFPWRLATEGNPNMDPTFTPSGDVRLHTGLKAVDQHLYFYDANFPMALNHDVGHVLAAFRTPAKLGVFSIKDGALIASPEICGDADDVFVDAKRHRVYVSCGQGFLDVLDSQGSAYKRIARIPTVPGARTSLFVSELDRLFLAVRAASGEPAAVWVFRPTP